MCLSHFCVSRFRQQIVNVALILQFYETGGCWGRSVWLLLKYVALNVLNINLLNLVIKGVTVVL